MSTCTVDPEERYPLRGCDHHRGHVPQKNGDDKGITAVPLLLSPRHPSPPGFICPSVLQPSADDNPYETPPAFNPHFKSVTNETADQPADNIDQMKKPFPSDVENATPAGTSQDDGYCHCSGLHIVVIVMAVVFAIILYVTIKYPNLVKAVHSDINEYENEHGENPTMRKKVSAVLTNELKKLVNQTNIATTPAPRPPQQEDGAWFIDDGFMPHLV